MPSFEACRRASARVRVIQDPSRWPVAAPGTSNVTAGIVRMPLASVNVPRTLPATLPWSGSSCPFPARGARPGSWPGTDPESCGALSPNCLGERDARQHRPLTGRQMHVRAQCQVSTLAAGRARGQQGQKIFDAVCLTTTSRSIEVRGAGRLAHRARDHQRRVLDRRVDLSPKNDRPVAVDQRVKGRSRDPALSRRDRTGTRAGSASRPAPRRTRGRARRIPPS